MTGAEMKWVDRELDKLMKLILASDNNDARTRIMSKRSTAALLMWA
jgi:hypothetical protein